MARSRTKVGLRKAEVPQAASAPVTPEPTPTVVLAAMVLEKSGPKTAVLGADVTADLTPEDAVAKALEVSTSWIVELPMVATALERLAKLGGSVLYHQLPDAPGRVFATTEKVAGDAVGVMLLVVDGKLCVPSTAELAAVAPEPSAIITKAMRRVVPVLKTAEERFVLGVVLEPETVDSQQDIYSAEEVRNAAHKFMEDYRNLGKQHAGVVNDKLKILESYVAPADFTIGEASVKKDSWVLGIRVVDDALWKSVKAGDFTGFSIGGSAYKNPDTGATPAAEAAAAT